MPQASRQKTEDAVRALLCSVGHTPKGDLEKTPSRVASMWHGKLLRGQNADLQKVLGRGMVSNKSQDVCLMHIDVHLVCPHHLTVAFGTAHLGYVPDGRIASFGRLVDLESAGTARLVLQEDATTHIADALVRYLGAQCAVAGIEATHPCHNITRPKAHRSRAVTWATAGTIKDAKRLEKSMRLTLTKTS